MSLRTNYQLQAALTAAYNAGKDFVSALFAGVKASGKICIVNAPQLIAGSDTITVRTVAFAAINGAVTPGDAEFDASGTEEQTATSLAAQINAFHGTSGYVTAVASGNRVIVEAIEPGVAGNSIQLIYTQNGATGGACTDPYLSGGLDPLAVGAAYTTMAIALAQASADGKTQFKVNCQTNHKPAVLRLEGNYWKAYKAGVIVGLAQEDIYDYECTVSIDTTDTVDTYIVFDFNFQFGN
jgi:hypothetical protein